jgi:hypothetical protein
MKQTYRHLDIIPLGPANNPLSQSLFKDLQSFLLEPAPLLVHVESVEHIVNADNIHSIEITNRYHGVTLRELYDHYKETNTPISIKVSHRHTGSH